MPRFARLVAAVLVLSLGSLALSSTAAADDVSAAQRRAAGEFLTAAAAGDAQALAFALHPAELERLRSSVLQQLRDEDARGMSTLRARLFGEAQPLADIERLTSINFFRALARRLQWQARPYEELSGLVAVRDGNLVHVLVRGRQPRGLGKTEVVEVVSLLAYGKEWKAALPLELAAQLEDVIAGRRPVDNFGTSAGAGSGSAASAAAGSGAAASGSGAAGAPPRTERNTPQILALLDTAEKSLVDGRCDTYYREHLSPELRRTLGARTVDTLISACTRSMGNRELLVAALRIVRRTAPVYEAAGNRAVYDVSAQGLPYDRFVLERIDGRWYIGE
ncbi:MAG: hypothetical protein FGM43_08040 [Sinobacteraceae bacterium]|nr:hypothetical protein [Nevskiaceae bacterium]